MMYWPMVSTSGTREFNCVTMVRLTASKSSATTACSGEGEGLAGGVGETLAVMGSVHRGR